MGQKKIAESPKRENESVFQRSINLAAEEREKKTILQPGARNYFNANCGHDVAENNSHR